MSHLDGINYGYDQISSEPNLPLQFDMAEWEGKPILATNNEYPHLHPVKYPFQTPKISEKSLTGKLIPPDNTLNIPQLQNSPDTKSEGFRIRPPGVFTISYNDVLCIFMILIACILAFQVTLYTQLINLHNELRLITINK